MKPTTIAAAAVAVLSAVSLATATPMVPINRGFVVSEESAAGDVCGAVSGPRFSFSGCNTAAGTGGWIGPIGGMTGIGGVIGDNQAALVMAFAFDALPEPHRSNPDLVQPFKMTGAFFPDGLDGSPEFDVIAHGQMSVLWLLYELTTLPQWRMEFDFGGRGHQSLDGPLLLSVLSERGATSLSVDNPASVSESPTVVLLAVSLAGAIAIRARRRGLPSDAECREV